MISFYNIQIIYVIQTTIQYATTVIYNGQEWLEWLEYPLRRQRQMCIRDRSNDHPLAKCRRVRTVADT